MINIKTYKRVLEVTAIFLAALCLFTIGLKSEEIIRFDTRFYLFALTMWRHGLTWFPMSYHKPYPDYTSLSTIFIYSLSSLFGGLNKLTAILPSALAAALTVTVTYLVGALHSKRWGLCAIFYLLMTITFLKSAREISLDMYPTMITITCFYLIYSADLSKKFTRRLWIYPLLIFSFACRGPIGLVIPAAVIVIYYLVNRDYKQFFISGTIAFLLLMVGIAGLLAIAYHAGGNAFMQDVLRMQIIGRIDNPFLPIYYYFVNSIFSYAIVYPLAIIVMLGIARTKIVTPEMKLVIRLFAFVMIILIGMSIPGDKKTRYILPIAPALALIAAYPFSLAFNEKLFTYYRKIIALIFLCFPGIILLMTAYLMQYAHQRQLAFTVPYLQIIQLFLVLQMYGIVMFLCLVKKPALRELLIIAMAAFCFFVMNFLIAEPIQLSIDRARDLVQKTESLRAQQHAKLVFYHEQSDGLPVKYLVNLSEEFQPIFLPNEKSLIQFHEPAIFITSREYFLALPEAFRSSHYRIIREEKLGHVSVVIFSQK